MDLFETHSKIYYIYNMKRILLIGGNGYIGSRLYKDYSNDYIVTIVDSCWFDKPLDPAVTLELDINELRQFIKMLQNPIIIRNHIIYYI